MKNPSESRSASGSAGAGSRVFITGLGLAGPLGVGSEALSLVLERGFAPASPGTIRVEDYISTAKIALHRACGCDRRERPA